MSKKIPKEARPVHIVLSGISVGCAVFALCIAVYYQIWLLALPLLVVAWYFAKSSCGVEYV